MNKNTHRKASNTRRCYQCKKPITFQQTGAVWVPVEFDGTHHVCAIYKDRGEREAFKNANVVDQPKRRY
jgi:hypothetical protein